MRLRSSPAGPPAASISVASGGIGRSSSPAAEAISDDLRRGESAALDARRRIAALSLAAKAVLDAASGIYLGLEQGTKHKRFCTWCLIAAGASIAMVPVAVPEARRSWEHLRRG